MLCEENAQVFNVKPGGTYNVINNIKRSTYNLILRRIRATVCAMEKQ